MNAKPPLPLRMLRDRVEQAHILVHIVFGHCHVSKLTPNHRTKKNAKNIKSLAVTLLWGLIAACAYAAPISASSTAYKAASATQVSTKASSTSIELPEQRAPYSMSPKGIPADWAYPVQDPFGVLPVQAVVDGHSSIQLPEDAGIAIRSVCGVQNDSLERLITTPRATEPITLSLQQALDIAICRNTDLRESWANIQYAAANLGQAKAAYSPTLSASVGRIRQSESYRMGPVPNSPSSALTYATSKSISLNWRLWDAGTRYGKEQSANWQLEAALANRQDALRKLVVDIAQQYFAVQSYQKILELRKQALPVTQSILQSTQNKISKGASDQIEILQAISNQARANLELSRSQGEFDRAKAQLNNSLGLPNSTGLEVTELDMRELKTDTRAQEESFRLIDQDVMVWLENIKTHHPAIRAAKAGLKSSQQNTRSIVAEGLPVLDLSLDQYQNGRPNQSISSTQSTQRTALVLLTVPLFDGFARTYQVRAAQAQEVQKQIELERVERKIDEDAVQTLAQAKAAWSNVLAAQAMLIAAEEVQQSILRKYDKGVVAQNQLNQSTLDVIEARQEMSKIWGVWDSARLALMVQTSNIYSHR